MKKFGCIGGIVLLLILAGFVWFKFYFPFGDDSVKDGYLNKIERKGYLFKTWEGTIIQTGIKSVSPGAVQSNTFEFSVQSDEIARELQRNSGKYFVLHYKEYKGALPWRGHSKYIVDSIISIRDLGGEARPNY